MVLTACGGTEELSDEQASSDSKVEEGNSPPATPVAPSAPGTPVSPTPAPEVAGATPQPSPTSPPPNAPSNLQGTISGQVISLNWTDNADNETSFAVELLQLGGQWQRAGEPAADSTFTHVTAPQESTVYVRVAAYNAHGMSAYSNVIELVRPEAPDNEQIALGESLWTEKTCVGCHGNEPGETADRQVRAAIANATFVTKTAQSMPLGSPGSCDDACAQAIAAWLQTLYPVALPPTDSGNNNEGRSGNLENRGFQVPDITPDENALLKSLHKFSLSLAFTLPSQEWVDLVKREKEAGLEAVVREVLEWNSFYQRLAELYNPVLQGFDIPSNRYAENIGGRANWFNDFRGGNVSAGRYARWEIWAAINNEPFRLIEHVIRNDLPFTEILTADYTLVNYFSARSYNVLDQVEFTEIESPPHAEFPYSPWEYKKAYLPMPTAGILTSSVFVTIYPTTAGNVNRHRANTVFKLFLDTDILDIPGSRVEADDIRVENPTLNNPSCTSCHNVMDPVAAAFRHWQLGERRREDWRHAGWNQDAILAPGFNGVEMPADDPAPLQWLARQIAADPRFALSTVKTLFAEITGHPVLPVPDPLADALTVARYDHQQEQFQIFANRFIRSGYKVKELVVDLVLSDYFRNEEYLGGTRRLIPNVQLKRKVAATLNVHDFGATYWIMNDSSYAGDQPDGIMTLIQRLAGSDIACLAIPADMGKPENERQLLPHFVFSEVLNEAGEVSAEKESQIKQNLKNLMWVLWGETVDLDDPNLISLYNTYIDMVRAGKKGLTEGIPDSINPFCGAPSSLGFWIGLDDQYIIRAWIGVVNVMIDDFRFLYD